jgi:hypothetical protein
MDLPVDVLSRRALSFVRVHGQRVPADRMQRSAAQWIEQGLDGALVQRAVDYEKHWGDLYLPPSLLFEGGPRYLGADVLLGRWSDGGYLEAGPSRVSVYFDFLLRADGAFGVGDVEFIPLYASVEDWIESLALEYEVLSVATEIRRFRGPEIPELDLSAMSPFPGLSGLSEQWMIDADRIVFFSRGTGLVAGRPDEAVAIVYSGISDRESYLGIRPS